MHTLGKADLITMLYCLLGCFTLKFVLFQIIPSPEEVVGAYDGLTPTQAAAFRKIERAAKAIQEELEKEDLEVIYFLKSIIGLFA